MNDAFLSSQLLREAHILDLFTSLKCEHAVHLTGICPVNIDTDNCWFVMELLNGDDMESVLKIGPISDKECIKVERPFRMFLSRGN